MRVSAFVPAIVAGVVGGQAALANTTTSISTPMVFSSSILSPTIVGWEPMPQFSVVSNQFSDLGLQFAGQDDPNITAPGSFLVDTSVLVALAQIQQFVNDQAGPALLPAAIGKPGKGGGGAGGGPGGGGGGGGFGGGGGGPGGGGTPGGGGNGTPGGGNGGPGGGSNSSDQVTPVPVPLSAPMLASALAGLVLVGRRRRR